MQNIGEDIKKINARLALEERRARRKAASKEPSKAALMAGSLILKAREPEAFKERGLDELEEHPLVEARHEDFAPEIDTLIVSADAGEASADTPAQTAVRELAEESSLREVSAVTAPEEELKAVLTRRAGRSARKRRSRIIGALAGSFMALTGISLAALLGQSAFAVSLGGETIGYVSDEAEYATVLAKAKTDISAEIFGADIIVDDSKVEVKKTFVTKKRAEDGVARDELATALKKNDAVSAGAYEIKINGEPIAVVAKQEDADAVVSGIEEKYKNSAVVSGAFKEEIAIESAERSLGDIRPTEEVVNYLLTGTQELDKYIVEPGDTVWGIANEHGLSIEDISYANPGINVDSIHSGDEILVSKLEPMLHYETVGEETTTEAIAFDTVNENNGAMFEGETKVAQEGKAGEKNVTRKVTRVNGDVVAAELIGETVISAPVNKIIHVGTKKKPAPAAAKPSKGGTASTPGKAYNPSLGNGVVADVQKFLGVPYVYGGSSPSGFDCSGLVQYVYKANGISLPRTAAQISAGGSLVSLDQMQPGDIVCWGTRGRSGHVAIYVGGGKFVHAPQPGTYVRYDNVATYGNPPKFAVRY